jgi:hypothetical protein
MFAKFKEFYTSLSAIISSSMVRSGRRAFLHRARVAREHEDVESFRHIRNELIEYWYVYIEQEDLKKENMNRKMSRMLETDTYPSHEADTKSGRGSSISEPQSPITLDAQKMAAEGIPMQGNQTDQQALQLQMMQRMQRMQRMQAHVRARTNAPQAGSSSNDSSSVDNTYAISSLQSLPPVHSQMSQFISFPIHIQQQLQTRRQAQAQHMHAQQQAQHQAQLQAQLQAQQQAHQAQQAQQQAWHSLPHQSSPPQNDPNHWSLPPPNAIVGSPESMSTSCMIRHLPHTLKTSDTVPPPVSVAQAAMSTQYQPSAHSNSNSMHSRASVRTTAATPQYETNCLDPMTSTWLDNYSPTTETIDLKTADNANAPSSSSSRVRKRSASSSGTSTTVHESTGTEEGEESLAKKRRRDASLEEQEDMRVSTDTGGGNDGSVVFEVEVDEDGYISFDSNLIPGWDGVGKGKGKVAWNGVN